jgi:hypothetical protein
VLVVGKDRWHHSVHGGEAEWPQDIERLPVEIRDWPELLPAELLWLCSDQAHSAAVLGDALGRCDGGAACLDAIVSATVGTGATEFAAAYVRALLRSHPGQAEAVNRRLDEAEPRAPEAGLRPNRRVVGNHLDLRMLPALLPEPGWASWHTCAGYTGPDGRRVAVALRPL